MTKVRVVKVKTYNTGMDEVTATDIAWIRLALKELCPELNSIQLSKRAVLARAMRCYVGHLSELVEIHNTTKTGDFDARADIRFEAMTIKQTSNPLAKPVVSLETLEKHGITAHGKLHTLHEIREALPTPKKKPASLNIPRWLLRPEENAVINKAQAARKAKREARQRGDT